MITKEYLDSLTYSIIGCAIEVHKAIGPGLLESVYHKCMKREFEIRNINFISEIKAAVNYKELNIATELRCDFLIENVIAVELKSVDGFVPVFDAQVLTYMKLLSSPKGILINFNCMNIFKEGQKTFVNELYRNLPEK